MGNDTLFWTESERIPGEIVLMEMSSWGIATPYRRMPEYCYNYRNFERLGFTNYMPITGFERSQACTVYDPNQYEFEEITAPVKQNLGVTKGYADYVPARTHTGKVPTQATFKAAQKVAEDLDSKLSMLAIADKQSEFDTAFKALCDNGICIYYEDLLNTVQLEVNPNLYTLVNLNSNDHPLFQGIIIKKDALPVRVKSIELRVYRNSVAFAIGSKGKNAKKMAEALGVRYVDIISKYY